MDCLRTDCTDCPRTGDETRFVLLDLYVISLTRYRREGKEKRWSFVRFFAFSSGIGELTE